MPGQWARALLAVGMRVKVTAPLPPVWGGDWGGAAVRDITHPTGGAGGRCLRAATRAIASPTERGGGLASPSPPKGQRGAGAMGAGALGGWDAGEGDGSPSPRCGEGMGAGQRCVTSRTLPMVPVPHTDLAPLRRP